MFRIIPALADECAGNQGRRRERCPSSVAAVMVSTVEGDIDLLGILGLSDDVRNGYRQIRVHFDVDDDASPDQLRALVEQSRRRSAVYDVLVNGTDVQIDVSTP
jgi:hypothetical protein